MRLSSMRQTAKKPKGYNVQKDSNVTSSQRYSQFLGPRYWLTWLGIAGLYLMAWTPWRFKVILSKGMGRLIKLFVKSRYRVLETNIRLCFPERSATEQANLVQDALTSNMLGYFETAFVWCRKVKTIPLELEGLEHYEKAKATGKGIIFITGHFTPLDLGAAILGRNFDIGTVYRRHNNALFNYFMTRAREQYVSYTIARKDFRGMVRHLRKGDSLIYLPDQDFGRKHSVFVPFFGIQTASIPTTTALAKTGDAIVLPVSGYRRGWDFKYVVNLEAPLNIPSDDSLEDTKVWNQWLEKTVRAHPDQYLWLHKRFKTRPEGEPSVYN